MVGPFTCDQQTFIQVATRLSGSLSLIGTVAIMISYILFARFRTSSNKLLLFANMGEFCIALMCVLSISTVPNMDGSPLGSQDFCTVQGAISTFALIAVVLWSMFMAIQCYLAVYVKKTLHQLESLHKYYHVIAWSSAAIVTAITLSLPYFYNDGPVMKNVLFFCWISSAYQGWRWIFFGPLWVSMFVNMVLYGLVVRKLHLSKKNISKFTTSQENRTDRAMRLFVWRTFVYVGIFFINWLFPTINRIHGLIPNTKPLFWLTMLHAVSAPIGGFLNSIAYFYFARIIEGSSSESSMKTHINNKSINSDKSVSSVIRDSKKTTKNDIEEPGHLSPIIHPFSSVVIATATNPAATPSTTPEPNASIPQFLARTETKDSSTNVETKPLKEPIRALGSASSSEQGATLQSKKNMEVMLSTPAVKSTSPVEPAIFSPTTGPKYVYPLIYQERN